MAKRLSGKQGIIGAVGAVLIGSALLLFVVTMVLNSLAGVRPLENYHKWPHDGTAHDAYNASAMRVLAGWNATNASLGQLKTFLTVSAILLGILGIVLIGAMIINTIGGGFGE